MKTLQMLRHLAVSLVFALGILPTGHAQSVKNQVSQVLNKLFFEEHSRKHLGPENNLQEVISVAFWNEVSGGIPKSELQLVTQHIATDNGLVAEVLFERGFNYSVLKELREVMRYDPNQVSYGVIDVSGIPKVPAGIPEFTRVQTEHWETSMQGFLQILYRKDVHWVLEQARSQVDKAVRAAGTTPHSLLNLFVNRHRQAQSLLEFFGSVESSLTQYQALLATLEIRKKSNPTHAAQLEKVEAVLQNELNTQLQLIRGVLTAGTKPQDSAPWATLAKAIEANKAKLQSSFKNVEAVAIATVDGIDKILGNKGGASQFSQDEVPELVLKLKDHKQRLEKSEKAWDEMKIFEYHDRTHSWQSIDLHSEEKSPYYETGRTTKTRDIPGYEVAPVIQEQEIASLLTALAVQLTTQKLQSAQILQIREQLLKVQQTHRQYRAQGPLQAKLHPNQVNGYRERFQARNEHLSQWIELAIENTFRHEAHERKGYVGIQFETEINPTYQVVLDNLETVAKKFRKAWVAIGSSGAAAAIGGACYLFMR